MPVQTLNVTDDENDLRLDRWFKRRFPGLSHIQLEKLLRTGQVRVDGGRVKASHRLNAGQAIRVPPLPEGADAKRDPKKIMPTEREKKAIKDSILYEDKDVLVINKPPGLAVQGGTGLSRHLDGFMSAIYKAEERPKLVHRLDRETSGVLVLAKNDHAAAKLAESFRRHDTRKYYWALTHGVPKPKQGKIQLPLAKGKDGRMVVDEGEEGKASTTLYQVVESAMKVAFVALWPLTGRTHQLRVHLQAIETPILGDDMYAEGLELAVDGDVKTDQLHLHARRLIIPHPRSRKMIDVTAPLPPHLKKAWAFFEFPQDDGDPFESYAAGKL